MTKENDCPRCGSELDFDEVDIGVGVLRGNPGCPSCHWTPEIKCSCSESKEACPLHGIAASNMRQNEFWKKNRK